MTPLVDDIAVRAQYQPEAFRGVTELQGGWFSQVGGTLSAGHNAAQITQVTLTAIERGCTMINYYMFYGGSNFGYSAARTVTQSYDYNAPLREWGGTGDRYYAVKAIGQMLQEHGQQLINSEPVELKIEGDHRDVSIYLRQSEDGSQFYFMRNSREHESRSGTVKVWPKVGAEQELTYSLGSFEAKVLYVPPGTDDLADGEWLPKPVEATAVSQSTLEPVPVRVVSIAGEEPSIVWRRVPIGKHLEFADVFDQRYVYYRVNFSLSADDLAAPMGLFVLSDGGGGSLAARVNGTEVPPVNDGFIALDSLAREGSNTAEVLFENLGCHRFGPDIEQAQGITRISVVPRAAHGQALEDWRMKLVPVDSPAATLAEIREDFDDHAWQPVHLEGPAAATPAGKSAVYRASLSVSQDRLAAGVILTFPVIHDRGILYVNGRDAGRATDWSQPWTFEITEYLHEGNNSIALLVHNDWGNGGPQRGCSVEPVGRRLYDLQVAPTTRVTDDQIDDDQHRRLLTHYAMEFQLPRTPQSLSVPWKLHLNADANAFVTLNGHLLGRYWSAGPQRDIWLPECWLNFGPETKNVIQLQARPTADAPVGKIIKQAEVRPYEPTLNAVGSPQ